ncbi:F-box/kelch-repeat protein At3g23880 [Medicago truncatula]|uniref:F-box/kelch-repeat protein At3g23880 n=1 Tax=Medicago truncatula TaxID=3880 RepID=UPI000D2F1A8E|nr:F-box/kelch-repeat protein At3g23880 [Medicago truncatula]
MTPSLVFLLDDLIAEVLSFLPVKPLLRFKSVSKSWKILISDPTFVKLHLKRSAVQNPHFTLIMGHEKFIPGESFYGIDDESERDYNLVPYPISRLLDNPSFTLLLDDPYNSVTYYHVNNDICSRIIGSCNGLICLAETSLTHDGYQENWRREYWFRVWNPSIRTTTSEKFGYFYDFGPISGYGGDFNFKFGFDNSTDTYKVLAFRYNRLKGNRNIKILGSGDHVWRDIAFFPVVPLRLDYSDHIHSEHCMCDGVYVSGTFNWLAIHNDLPYRVKNITVEHFVIVSLDLGTETYNQYLLPLDEVPSAEPTVGVLGGCLCFSYAYKETDFVIWQMKKFGDEDSWSQFLRISYQNLLIDYDIFDTYFRLVPLLLSKDGDTLILKSSQEFEAIIYHWKDNRVQRTKITPSRTITYDRRITNWVAFVYVSVLFYNNLEMPEWNSSRHIGEVLGSSRLCVKSFGHI